MSQVQHDPTTPNTEESETTAEQLVDAELLVEDVSIDGMCGVY
jgi:mycofactocin precursor